MARVPESLRAIVAGTVAEMVGQACAQCKVLPAELLDYSVKPDRVVIILPAGQKVSFGLAPIPPTPFPPDAPYEAFEDLGLGRVQRQGGASLPESADNGFLTRITRIEELAAERMHKIAGRANSRRRQVAGGKVNDV